jgi:hypothetical protein
MDRPGDLQTGLMNQTPTSESILRRAFIFIAAAAVAHDAAPSPETDEIQHHRIAQHNGPPCHGVFIAVQEKISRKNLFLLK